MEKYSKKRPVTRLTAYSGQFWVWAITENTELRGCLMHMHDKSVYAYHSTLELIKRIDLCLDRIGAAEVSFKPRKWAKDEGTEGDEQVRQKTNLTVPAGGPTFVIKVERRQNATWQGVVQWLDGEREQRFRSALELIFLLEDIVSQAPIPAEDMQTWVDGTDLSAGEK